MDAIAVQGGRSTRQSAHLPPLLPIYSLPKRRRMASPSLVKEDNSTTTDDDDDPNCCPIEVLSDDGLLLIFELVDLADLLQSVSLVCTRWRRLSRRARLGRHTLRLDVGLDPMSIARRAFHPPSSIQNGKHQEKSSEVKKDQNSVNKNTPTTINNQSKNSSLRVVAFSQRSSRNLAGLLPNIKSLELNIDRLTVDSGILPAILGLLTSYQAKLVSLRLSVRFAEASQHLGFSNVEVGSLLDRFRHPEKRLQYARVGTAMRRILAAVNRLEKLDRLWFAAWHYCLFPAPNRPPPRFHLPIARQLSRLHFFSHDSSLAVLPALQQNNANLAEIELLGTAYEGEVLHSLLAATEQEEPMVRHLTGLSLNLSNSTNGAQPLLAAFVGRFSGLTRLEVTGGGLLCELGLPRLTAALGQLPLLSRLRLCLNVEAYIRRQHLFSMAATECDEVLVGLHRLALTPLPSVSALELTLSSPLKWHRSVVALGLEAVFPAAALTCLSVGLQAPCQSCARSVFLFNQAVVEVGRGGGGGGGGNRPATRSATAAAQQQLVKVFPMPPGRMPPDLLFSRILSAKESCARLALERLLLPTVQCFTLESEL